MDISLDDFTLVRLILSARSERLWLTEDGACQTGLCNACLRLINHRMVHVLVDRRVFLS